MKLLAENCLARARVTAFVDGNPVNQGKSIGGVAIIAPQEITDRARPIIVATLLQETEIIETIRETLRLPNRVVTLSG
ncbi:MAG: hypothetical protein ACR2HH_16395 [Chthoniobacterales bacterium]